MAAGNFTIYNAAAGGFGIGAFTLASDNFNVVLLTTAYNPPSSAATDSTYANISSTEASGTGYTAGGTPLTGVSWVQSVGTGTFSAQSPQWTGATFSARYAVVVRRAGTSIVSSDLLLGYVDLTGGGNQSVSAGTFQVNWNNASTPSSASTIFTMTHNP